MTTRLLKVQAVAASIIVVLWGASPVAADKLYKWVDREGNLHYTDQQPPPTDVKSQERKKFGDKPAESGLPYALQRALKNFPVTLYSADCGDVCTKAAAHLSKRGVPFTEKNVRDPKVSEELKALTGASKLEVPVLKLGNHLVRGYEEGQWNSELDGAGYPRSPAASPEVLKAAVKPAGATGKPTGAGGEKAAEPDGNKAEPSTNPSEPGAGQPEGTRTDGKMNRTAVRDEVAPFANPR